MHRTLMIALLALGSGSALPAQPAASEPQPASAAQSIEKTGQAEDVRFKTETYDRMTVPVLLSGNGPYRFLVDTGADRTAISREIAARLRLPAGDDAALHTLAGVSTVQTANVADLEFTRRGVKVVDAALLASADMGADGILGTDSLRLQRVMFDFQGQTMTVEPSAAPERADEPGSIVIEATRRNGRLIVTDATANGRRMTVIVDTGSQVSIGNEALRQELMSRSLIDPAQQVELISVTGERISGDYMFIRQIELGGIEIRDLAVVFADAHTFKQLKLDKRPALLLGMNALRAFKKVSIDFANRKFRVVVPERTQLDTLLASASF